MRICIFFLLMLIGSCRLLFANILNVPTSENPTIQAGIDAAVNGDIVLVADGTYFENNIVIDGKLITVKSASGSLNCIIDCSNAGGGFIVTGGTTLATVIDGFTILNGNSGSGGGIFMNGLNNYGAVTIQNCFIWKCAAQSGGGIKINGLNPCVVRNCVIAECVAANTFYPRGGGIEVSSNSEITQCYIANCQALNSTNNGGYGGGIASYYSKPTITSCVIANNKAHSGGGVCIFGEDDNSGPRFINCDIVYNQAVSNGGGIWNEKIDWNTSVVGEVDNSIIYGNTPNEWYSWYFRGPYAWPTMNYCLYGGIWEGPGGNNFTAPPQFVNYLGPDGNFDTWQDNDWRIADTSPCKNAGNNNYVNSAWLDRDGQPRIMDGTVDIGADEIYVAPAGTTISGHIIDENNSNANCNSYLSGRAFTWKLLSTGTTGNGTLDVNRNFIFTTTETGISDICLKVNGALSKRITGLNLSGGTIDIGTISVLFPDVLNDDIWDDFELNEINGGFGNNIMNGTGADFNCDGIYDDFDLNQINGGFGSTGDCYGL